MIPTDEINGWITEHGNTRDALNVALARLATVTEKRDSLTVSLEGMLDARDGFAEKYAVEREAHKVTAVALDTTTKERNHAFSTGMEYASRLEAEREHADELMHTLEDAAQLIHTQGDHSGPLSECENLLCSPSVVAINAHYDARRNRDGDGGEM